MLNLACKHKECLARGYENNINSYPEKKEQPKPIMQRGPKKYIKTEMKETELHAGPIGDSVRTH